MFVGYYQSKRLFKLFLIQLLIHMNSWIPALKIPQKHQANRARHFLHFVSMSPLLNCVLYSRHEQHSVRASPLLQRFLSYLCQVKSDILMTSMWVFSWRSWRRRLELSFHHRGWSAKKSQLLWCKHQEYYILWVCVLHLGNVLDFCAPQ